MSTKSTDGARRLLKRELDAVAARLHAEAEVPKAASPAGDFLDVAQGVQNQELARLNAERLSARAQRLRIALSRVSDGEYGVCAECGDSIAPKRLVAVPDATTCLACQERLERPLRAPVRGREEEAAHGRVDRRGSTSLDERLDCTRENPRRRRPSGVRALSGRVSTHATRPSRRQTPFRPLIAVVR